MCQMAISNNKLGKSDDGIVYKRGQSLDRLLVLRSPCLLVSEYCKVVAAKDILKLERE